MEPLPLTNETAGEPVSTENKILTTGSSIGQSFKPIHNICAHLNAFHAYADEPSRAVEANHYCAHVNDEVRQCLLYDSAEKNARLIGIEYMVSPRIYESLPAEERKLWHSHVFEVKSGMLVMPNALPVPAAAWELAEKREMEQVIELYGKVYHLWQTDRGDKVPLGGPKLMTSFTADGQLDFDLVAERDKRFGTDHQLKKASRKDIPSPRVHPDADMTWSP